MADIEKILNEFLADARSVVFLAIGSELRADDAAGLFAAESLLKENLSDKIKIVLGYTAPENVTGEIKKAKPSHLIICDAADCGLKAGETSVIAAPDAESSGGEPFSTHTMPMSVFINYIQSENPCKTLIIGIQPENLEFGAPMSPTVKKAAQKLSSLIALALAQTKSLKKA